MSFTDLEAIKVLILQTISKIFFREIEVYQRIIIKNKVEKSIRKSKELPRERGGESGDVCSVSDK